MSLRIFADEQRHPKVGQVREQAIEPQRRAFASRRPAAACGFARVATTHRNDRDLRSVIERTGVHSHPVTQPLAARVVPRDARPVYAQSWSLSDDQNAGRRVRLQYRARPEQLALGFATSAKDEEQLVERKTRSRPHISVSGD